MVGLLLIASICTYLLPYGYYEVDECVYNTSCESKEFWTFFVALLFSIQNLCFSVAHWLFAQQYYEIAQIMPYALEELLVPQKIKTKLMWVNRFMLAMIIIFSLASGPILYFTYKAEIKQNEITPKTDKFYTMDNVVCVFLSFISGIYLLSAVYKITKYMRKKVAVLDKIDHTS